MGNVRSMGGIIFPEAKRIAHLLFGEQVIKISLNEKDFCYEILIEGETNIPAEMQKRFNEQLKQFRIIQYEKIEQKTVKK